MPIDPVKIPQNVQIEDKVVGPLSLRQIIIMALGGGFSYMVYAAVQKSVGHVSIPLTIVIWIPALIAAAFAMVNINDLSLLRICFLLLERTQKPGRRTWGPRQGITITIRTSFFKDEKAPANSEGKTQGPTAGQQIAELSTVVDRHAYVADEAVENARPPAAMDDDSVNNPEEAFAPAPRPPVNPDRIQADGSAPEPLDSRYGAPPKLTPPQLSDLSVFRDIFPPNA